ncbi:MAG: VWA domain-containing protein [Candidatus Limnocylindrales bacterium]
MRRARFGRWDGSQQLADLSADEIIEALTDDLIADGDLGEALRRLLERGWRSGDASRPDLPGLDGLRERLRARRDELLKRYRLGDVMGDIRVELEQVVQAERAAIDRRLAAAGSAEGAPSAELNELLRETAARRLDRLDSLPADLGGQVRALEEYDFFDSAARTRFEALVERLRRSILDRYAAGMADAVRSVSPDDLAANRAMVRDLDQLLQQQLAGAEPNPSEFLARHGSFFPGANTVEDIINQLAERMSAMQSLLRSLSADQRSELNSLIDGLLRDDRLRWDLAQLSATLDQLLPEGLGQRFRFGGEGELGLEGALDQIETLDRIERLDGQLGGVQAPGDLGQIDRTELGALLDENAARELDGLDELAARLEAAGYLTADGDHLELTPRGNRRIGQKVLDDLFARLRRDAFGEHRIERAGRSGERTEGTKPFEFGDPFDLDLRETLANALQRPENAPGREAVVGAGRRAPAIQLAPDDFAVHRAEESTRTATVLLVDMSRSMLLRGCFVAAKKVAVALDTLIRTQYPRDDLTVIGFAYYAREIPPGTLAQLSWHGYEYGTNLQHGLLLARRILARSGAANRQVVVITDGEPTAHFQDGQVEFNYPPTRRTIEETLREVQRCTKAGITINTFMLERSRALTDFIAEVTRLNRGRAFYAEPEHLGEYVLVDFVRGRTAQRRS